MDNKLKQEIWSYFKPMQKVYFATSQDNKPSVRPLSLIFHKNKFWIATGSGDAKIKQIESNNKVEFCLFISDDKNGGYIRGSGQANIVVDEELRKMIFEAVPFIKMFWDDPADKGFTLLDICLSNIEYMKPGEMIAKKIEV